MSRFSRNRIAMHSTDFKRVFRENHRSGDGMLLVLARPNGLKWSRLGLAISKKHLPRAVERNRIKRIVRESFMSNQPFALPVDTVVLNRPEISNKDNHAVFLSLSSHWSKINQMLNNDQAIRT
jgi:ribonuclease P protein component